MFEKLVTRRKHCDHPSLETLKIFHTSGGCRYRCRICGEVFESDRPVADPQCRFRVLKRGR